MRSFFQRTYSAPYRLGWVSLSIWNLITPPNIRLHRAKWAKQEMSCNQSSIAARLYLKIAVTRSTPCCSTATSSPWPSSTWWSSPSSTSSPRTSWQPPSLLSSLPRCVSWTSLVTFDTTYIKSILSDPKSRNFLLGTWQCRFRCTFVIQITASMNC